MSVDKKEFEDFKRKSESSHEQLQHDLKSSYASILEYMHRLDDRFTALDTKFTTLDTKFTALDTKFDRLDQRLVRVSDDVSYLRSNTTTKFGLVEHEQIRVAERLTDIERRVDVLEGKTS